MRMTDPSLISIKQHPMTARLYHRVLRYTRTPYRVKIHPRERFCLVDLTTKQDQDAKQQAAQLLDELKKGRNVPIVSFSLWTKPP